MTRAISSFWAKTLPAAGAGYPLEQHLLDTAAAAHALWDVWLRPGLKDLIAAALPGADARSVVAAVSGLHDLGKANPRFQTQDGSPRHDPTLIGALAQHLRDSGLPTNIPAGAMEHEAATRRHETVSQHLVAGFPQSPTAKIDDDWAGVAVGGHHGQFYGRVNVETHQCQLASDALDALTDDPTWAAARNQVADLVLAGTGVSWGDIRRPLEQTGVALTLIAGLVVVADWLASSSLVTEAHRAPQPGETPEVWARRYTAERTSEFAAMLPTTLGVYRAPADPHRAVLGDYEPHPLQAEAKTVGRGLWIVAETTGSGKTEAAMLRHMTEDESVLWGLPTRATADRMWGRVQAMYTGTGNVGALLHAHRALDAFYLHGGNDNLTLSAWANEVLGNIKPLLSPVAVGTVDQILLGALRQKWTHVRLLALANAHLIIDEVHTFDAYQAELMCEVLRWAVATDTRVTMLSASLPQAMVEQFSAAYAGRPVTATAEYPAHALVTTDTTHVEPSPLVTAREYTLDIHLEPVDPEDLTATIVDQVNRIRAIHPDARVGVVVNRVDAAIAVGAAISDALVLHSRMTSGHRTEVGQAIADRFARARTGSGVLVGTQVIEASLDYDVDFMITELAPAPSLVQRAGRLWRHSTPTPHGWGHPSPRPGAGAGPKLIVLVPGNLARVHPAAALPYPLGALQRTLEALTYGHSDVTLAVPGDVQRIVDAAHFDPTAGDVGTTDEAAAAFARLANASAVTIGARRRRGPFADKVSHRTFSDLTSRDELAEPATRFTDYEQTTVVVVDEHGDERSLPDGELNRLLGDRSPSTMRRVLMRSVPVATRILEQGTALTRVDDGAEFESASLHGVVPVTLGSAKYDDRLGLILS